MKKITVSVIALAAVLAVAGCANDNEKYRADVYGPGALNQAQRVRTVEILSIAPARVALPNSRKSETAALGGALGGAILGAVIGNQFGHGRHSRAGGRLAGAAIGGIVGGKGADIAAGETDYQEGVQLTFRVDDQMYTSVQVGHACEYQLGTAMMVQQNASGSRIQPNNPGGCGAPAPAPAPAQ